MNLELPGDEHPIRQQFKKWLSEHETYSNRELAEGGWVVPHWPRPWGHDLSPIDQLVIEDELKKNKVQKPSNQIGIGWAGPTILTAGTQAQRDRYLFPIISGDEIWCQLFSEPDAGSDLASLRTTAVQDGDFFVVNGQKIWTSFGHVAKFGILLARTDSTADKHNGISYFICPMDAEGITVTPIIDMTGNHSFNQVFLDNVHIPKENLVGELNKGWSLAKVTLQNERVSLSTGGALWGLGPTAEDLIGLLKMAYLMGSPNLNSQILRDQLAKVYSESQILKWLTLRQVTSAIKGNQPGPESSVRKAIGDEHGQALFELAKNLSGSLGMLSDVSKLKVADKIQEFAASWHYGYAFSRALTIGGGTSEVQRNIIAERYFGLPKEPDLSVG
jgi:alkylation response protein AidB-like acyl-CoA dehydrogenase